MILTAYYTKDGKRWEIVREYNDEPIDSPKSEFIMEISRTLVKPKQELKIEALEARIVELEKQSEEVRK